MIKKAFLFAFGLILISNHKIFAQDFKLGFVIGFDVVNVHLIDKPNEPEIPLFYYPMISFNANGYVGFKSSGFLGFSAEPGFIQKGGKYKGTDGNSRFQLNYFQLPILADIFIHDKLYLSIGPEFSYLINAIIKSKDNSADITDIYDNRLEVSGLIGLNYGFIDKLDIGLRYNHGITYTSKITWTNEMNEEIGVSKEYNQYIQLLVRFKI